MSPIEPHAPPVRPLSSSSSFAGWLRERWRQTPYLVIALALDAILITVATQWRLGDGDEQLAAPFACPIAVGDPPPDAHDAPTNFADCISFGIDGAEHVEYEILIGEPELTFPDEEPVYGDHSETGVGEHYGMAKGRVDLFDAIGVVGSSGRGGRAGYGGPFGGRRNMTVRGGSGGSVHGSSGKEVYAPIFENPFLQTLEQPVSTFGADVDTASYAIVRRYLNHRALPPRDAIRVEEILNAFSSAVVEPEGAEPLAVSAEVASCPWNLSNRLAKVVVHARPPLTDQRPPANLVFLVDVSGSMSDSDKLPLVRDGMRLLVEQLTERDRVAIVTYASETRVALSSTPADRRDRILDAIESLSAGGATNGGSGIQLAYDLAVSQYLPGGINRVLLATDGDFNVGITDRDRLVEFVQHHAKSGVFLSVLGYGTGNLKDATLEALADKGNGHYAYIDGLAESRRVLSEQAGSTLQVVAKDVKIQVELNASRVHSWRLLGYENRLLAREDFADDRKDGGEMGAGHQVTALYEIVPWNGTRGVVAPRYSREQVGFDGAASDDLLTVRVRWKEPAGHASRVLERRVTDAANPHDGATDDFRWSAALACFGMCLRDSPRRGAATLGMARDLAVGALGDEPDERRAEFVTLTEHAIALARESGGR